MKIQQQKTIVFDFNLFLWKFPEVPVISGIKLLKFRFLSIQWC